MILLGMVHFLGEMGVHFCTSKMLVMLSEAKHPVLGFHNEILRRFAPQNDAF
jgi:hypothetical protein